MTLKKWFALFLTALILTPALWSQDDEMDAEDGEEDEMEEVCDGEPDMRAFTKDFTSGDCKFRTRFYGHQKENPYWIMEPGFQIVMEGQDEDEFIHLEITVLAETQMVDGVMTRVIEEREWKNDEIYEVSRNFYAICSETNDIYYFGEDVDFFEDGEIVDHHGTWRAGFDGAQPGVIMPGTIMLGARFYQEYWPGEAVDRAEIMDRTDVELGDQIWEDVIVLKESNPLEDDPCSFETKYYAPGVGIIKDEELELVEAGFLFRLPGSIFKDAE